MILAQQGHEYDVNFADTSSSARDSVSACGVHVYLQNETKYFAVTIVQPVVSRSLVSRI